MGLRLSGLASGLDSQALIDAILGVEAQPLRRAEARKADLELEQGIFRDLNTKLLALRDAAAALDNLSPGLTGSSFDEELLSYKANSSDEISLGVSANSNASAGTVDVSITQLASVARHITTAYSSDTDIIAAEGDTLNIDAGGASPIAITVGAGGASLTDLKDLINLDLDNAGSVRADVIFDGSGHRLVISGTQTGAVNDVSVTTTVPGEGAAPFLDAPLSVAANDAQLEVFGLAITRSSNTISDAVPGLTLTLNEVTTSPVQVLVQRDDEAVGEKLQAFVDAYNQVIDIFDTQASFDETTETAGPLSGDATLRQVENDVKREIVNSFSFLNNPFTSLGQIGVEVDRAGRLELDNEKLSAALDSDALSVRQLLGGDGVTDGAAAGLARLLDPITESATGLLAVRNDGFDRRIAGIDRQLESLERRLEKREESLIRQFSTLETTLAGLQNQGNALLALIININGSNNNR